ncbi:MAG: hypothetical protein ACYC5Y_13445 [Symbiobacteriia bacterium]
MRTKLAVILVWIAMMLSACGKAPVPPAASAPPTSRLPPSGSSTPTTSVGAATVTKDAVCDGLASFRVTSRLVLGYGGGESQVGYQYSAESGGWYEVPGSLAVDGRGDIYIDDPVNGRVQVYNLAGGEYVRTIPTAATRLGADASGRVYGIVSGGLGVLAGGDAGGGGATPLRPYHFISPVALRVSPDGTVVVTDSASETRSSARVVVLGVDGTAKELEDSGMFLNTLEGRRVELRSLDRGQPAWEVRVESSGRALTSWRYVPKRPKNEPDLWGFELIGLDKLDRAYFHRTTGPDSGAAGRKSLSDFIDILNTNTGHVLTIPLAPRGAVAAPGRGDGLFVDSNGVIYQLLETQSSVKVLEYMWTAEDQLPTGGVPSTDAVTAEAGAGCSTRIITASALEEMPRTADSIVLVAAGVSSKPSTRLDPEERARLQAILAGADSFQLEDDYYPSPTPPAPPGYEFRISYPDRELTLEVMVGSDHTQDVVRLFNLWGGGPDPVFMTTGLSALARQVLPIKD